MDTEADTGGKWMAPRLPAAGRDAHLMGGTGASPVPAGAPPAGTKVAPASPPAHSRRVPPRNPAAFFGHYSPEAREILTALLERYTTDGQLQFTLPDVLKVRPISDHGNVNEIIGKFGGAEQLRNALKKLRSLLYAA
jgi:hypothetical protein